MRWLLLLPGAIVGLLAAAFVHKVFSFMANVVAAINIPN